MSKFARFAAVAALVFTGASQAALVTTSAGFGASSVIDFSDQAQQFTSGPVQVGNLAGKDVVFTAAAPGAGFSYNGYGLLDNGTWGGSYAFINNGAGASITFTFNDGPVANVGGFVNYCVSGGQVGCGSGAFLIEALDASSNVLESYDINAVAAIATPGASNGGDFRGISRAVADIYAFRLVGGVGVIDDLTFSGQGGGRLPEPTGLLLSGLALAAAGLARRRK